MYFQIDCFAFLYGMMKKINLFLSERRFVIFSKNAKKPVISFEITGFSGTPEGIRTPDLLVRSQTLYPAELLAHTAIS